MRPPHRAPKATRVFTFCVATLALAGCAAPVGGGSGNEGGSGGGSNASTGGSTGAGGSTATGGSMATGGQTSSGGRSGSGGVTATGGVKGTGGTSTGGVTTTGGVTGTGGTSTGGVTATGGVKGTGGISATGGVKGTGGITATGGINGTGGAPGTGGSSTGTGGAGGDPCSITTMPSGGTVHTSANMTGMAAGLDWTIWSNGSAGSITTYSTPAFGAAWNNSGDFLARLGVQWNDSKTYDQFGTIAAQFNETKTGTGGGYSYIGIYGWSVSPCIEFYIVEDSYNQMPVNPGSTTNKGTATIDGGSYILYTRPTSGTGGSKCPGVSSWTQFYSVRKTARQCGTISISQHFAAWAAAGMTLGKMDQAQLLVEVGGGSGNINFTVANVTTTQ